MYSDSMPTLNPAVAIAASTIPLGDVDVIVLDANAMEVMTERFGIIFSRVNTTITRTPVRCLSA